MATLFELTEEQALIQDRLYEIETQLEESDGVITKEENEEYDRLLSEELLASEDIQDKLDNYGFVMSELEAEAEAIEGRMQPLHEILENLQARANSKKRQIERLKRAVLFYFEMSGEEKIECAHFRFRVQQNGGKRPLRLHENADPTSERYDKYVRRDFDRQTLREALEAGDVVAEEVAHLEERGHHLRVY